MPASNAPHPAHHTAPHPAQQDARQRGTITPAPLLRWALGLDAAVSAGAALLHGVGGSALAVALAWPADAVAVSGLFMAGYAVALALLARRPGLRVAWVRGIVAGNLLWAGGCAALAAGGVLATAGWGGVWLALLGAGPAGFALLQGLGLRRSRPDPARHRPPVAA